MRAVLLVLVVFTTVEVLHVRRYLALSQDQQRQQQNAPGRVFITGIFWNNEAILRETLSPVLLELVARLGPDNVYISIHESGSWDGTKEALDRLDADLEKRGVERTISTSNVTHADHINNPDKSSGWVDTPKGTRELRRIPFLAKERNVALQPLAELAAQGEHFDKVLFINDVVFSANDALTLLNTNQGTYAAACSMDFKTPPSFYDTFALRDAHGDEYLMPTWPYFRAAASRHAMQHHVPVPVKSCWNGMVAMSAAPFLAPASLRFRALPDSLAASHLEASECCLIHADNPLSAEKGVFVNPSVRVAYTRAAYEALAGVEARLSPLGVAVRLWENRVRRWTSTGRLKGKIVEKRVRAWSEEGKGKGEERVEVGGFCLINEMQVLREKGWAHV